MKSKYKNGFIFLSFYKTMKFRETYLLFLYHGLWLEGKYQFNTCVKPFHGGASPHI